jgi:hypothetical protein
MTWILRLLIALLASREQLLRLGPFFLAYFGMCLEYKKPLMLPFEFSYIPVLSISFATSLNLDYKSDSVDVTK